MTTYKPKEENRKKLLVPIIVLALCATALIGAGYAALASSTSADGSVDTDYIVLSFKEGETPVTKGFTETSKIELKTHNDGGTVTYGLGDEESKRIFHEFKLEIDSSKSGTDRIELDIGITGEITGKFRYNIFVNENSIVSTGYKLETDTTTFVIKIVLTEILNNNVKPSDSYGFNVTATATPL